MGAILIEGRTAAAHLCHTIARQVQEFGNGYVPGLAVVLVGDNPASEVYVRNKHRACKRVGIYSEVHSLPATSSPEEILQKIDLLNKDVRIHGILIQLPLPSPIESGAIISHIAPHKDIDGLHPQNLGLLMSGRPHFIPCTPMACLRLIQGIAPSLKGKHVVIVGTSLLVGRPLALLASLDHATVVLTHAFTVNLQEECRRADILISAVGKPGLITALHVKPGAMVIDVGITRQTDLHGITSLKGDVDFEAVRKIAGFLTPVPGGVGPMTVACLLSNTLDAARRS